jgi:formylglycine-generating enzyme required for sulfatase activity
MQSVIFKRTAVAVGLGCAGFFLAVTLMAAQHGAGAPAHVNLSPRHPPVKNDCVECHSDPKHTSVKVALTAECTSCHSAKVALSAVEQTPAPAGTTSLKRFPDEKAIERSIDPNSLTVTSGMDVAMYYDKSRIGAAPNPMVLIPAGPFIMGTNIRFPDEGPQHTVTLKAFYMDKYEVTNLQYKKFIDATHRRSPDHFVNRTYPEGKADHPVTYVNWYDAKAYCEWAGKRLPTDQEWEKAARGTDGRMFPWGNEFNVNNANTPLRWNVLHTDGDTTPVGAFEGGVSPYGLYDMSGNVWEWTSSWYEPYPGNTHVTENYGEKYKVLKGGSWWDCSFYRCGISAPVFNRSFFLRTTKNKSFGFRCAKDADRSRTTL